MNAAAFIAQLARHPVHAPALIGADGLVLSYGMLRRQVQQLADTLRAQEVRVLATCLDNGPAWVIADLAALVAEVVHVPLPGFFTAQQTQFVLQCTAADALIDAQQTDDSAALRLAVADQRCTLHRLRPQLHAAAAIHAGTAKITFTSGSTGQPKGVCLSARSMLDTAAQLAQTLLPLGLQRHLVSLPLPVLLENIAGVYAPLWAGTGIVTLPTADVGLSGAVRFDPARLQQAVTQFAADSLITLPQMLRAWTAWRLQPQQAPRDALKFVAVGGAHVGAALLQQARAVGLPAYEGYGLSEGASVQTLNVPGADRPGSAGRPLPHVQLRIGADGEIALRGSLMLGYLGQAAMRDTWLPTGDLGRIDADGYLHLDGRKKNLLITGFGRNVSPEWPEALLQAQPEIAQAVVIGDGAAALSAVLWPGSAARNDAALSAAVARVNAQLPDYARIARWVKPALPFHAGSGLSTSNGRPLRAAIAQAAATWPSYAVPEARHLLSTTE